MYQFREKGVNKANADSHRAKDNVSYSRSKIIFRFY